MAAAASYDYYEELEVSRTATYQEIKESYRRLAVFHHPDKNIETKEAATAKFQRIQNAYETLKDEASRMKYDAGSQNSAAQKHNQSDYRGSYQYADAYDSDDDDMGFTPAEFSYLRSFVRFFAEQRRWSEEQSEAQRTAEHAEERRKEERRKEREREEAVRRQKAQAEWQQHQRLSSELAFQKRYWARLGAVTIDEQIAACLHPGYSEERHQGKKFACGSCGLKKGFFGTECPFCSRLLCGPCSALADKKRAEAKRADAQGAQTRENETATDAAGDAEKKTCEAEKTAEDAANPATETESQKRRRRERQKMEQKKEMEREAKEKRRKEKQEKKDKDKKERKEREERARARARAREMEDQQGHRPPSECLVSEPTGSSSDPDQPTSEQSQPKATTAPIQTQAAKPKALKRKANTLASQEAPGDDPIPESPTPTRPTTSPEPTAAAKVSETSTPQPTCEEAKRCSPEKLAAKSEASTDSSRADARQSSSQEEIGGDKSMNENEKTAAALSQRGIAAIATGVGHNKPDRAAPATTTVLSSVERSSDEQGETERNGEATTAGKRKRNFPTKKQKPARNEESQQPKASTSASQEPVSQASTQHEGQTHDMDHKEAEKGAPGGKKRLYKGHKPVKKPSTTGPDPGTEGGQHMRCGFLRVGGDSRCFVMHPELRQKRAADGEAAAAAAAAGP